MVGVWKQEQATKIHRELCRTSCPQIAWFFHRKKNRWDLHWRDYTHIYIYIIWLHWWEPYVEPNVEPNVGCIPRIKNIFDKGAGQQKSGRSGRHHLPKARADESHHLRTTNSPVMLQLKAPQRCLSLRSSISLISCTLQRVYSVQRTSFHGISCHALKNEMEHHRIWLTVTVVFRIMSKSPLPSNNQYWKRRDPPVSWRNSIPVSTVWS